MSFLLLTTITLSNNAEMLQIYVFKKSFPFTVRMHPTGNVNRNEYTADKEENNE